MRLLSLFNNTRAEAKKFKAGRYYTGKPCVRGHFSERLTSTGSCCECKRENKKDRKDWLVYPESARRRKKTYRLTHVEQLRTAARRRAGLPEPTRPEPPACEVCGRPRGKTLCIDHDHETGVFRGWLCQQCNMAAGLVKESPDTLRKLASYLEQVNR
jgi:hypothetical protein